MVKLTVKIVSMQDADKFNKLCSKFDCDMDLQSGKYYVDAKSIIKTEPTALCNTVCLILESLGIYLIPLFEYISLEDFCVKLGNTVYKIGRAHV